MADWNIAPKCNFWVGSGTFWEWFSKLSSNLFTQLCNTGFFKKISPVCMQDQCGIIVLVYQEIVWASKWFRPQILTGVKGMLTHNIADEREGREEVHPFQREGDYSIPPIVNDHLPPPNVPNCNRASICPSISICDMSLSAMAKARDMIRVQRNHFNHPLGCVVLKSPFWNGSPRNPFMRGYPFHANIRK